MSFGQKKKWQHFFRLIDEISPQNLPQRQIHPSVTLADRDKQAWLLFHHQHHVRIEKSEKTKILKIRSSASCGRNRRK